jgi:hypothetical protein
LERREDINQENTETKYGYERISKKEPEFLHEARIRSLLLYALDTNLENPTQNIGFGPIVPPAFFTKLFDGSDFKTID